ncbi:MAG TPA: SDR family oxidoreductase [Thermoanaerobaculia bacterium]|jgi:3-oxoacyl-[acyl-carrier protein] reductase|nr:SDR family oxidoreductase [Thermoanaerobaculia bacterium]
MPSVSASLPAVVSGAGSGIGREIAIELGRRRHPLALLGRRLPPLEETLALAGGVGLALSCDVADPSAVAAAAAEIEARWGGAEILVPAAGVATIGPIETLDPQAIAAMLGINLGGTFHLLQAFLPGMKERRRGWIFPLLSAASRRGFPGWTGYCATKWGLDGMIAALREELKGSGIRISALFPGATDTPIWDGMPGDWNRAGMVPPSEIARAVAWALDAPESTLMEEIHIGPAGGAL